MSPLIKGSNSIRKNVVELMKPAQSPARKKAIATIARKHNISRADAQFRQSIKIAQYQARKK